MIVLVFCFLRGVVRVGGGFFLGFFRFVGFEVGIGFSVGGFIFSIYIELFLRVKEEVGISYVGIIGVIRILISKFGFGVILV